MYILCIYYKKKKTKTNFFKKNNAGVLRINEVQKVGLAFKANVHKTTANSTSLEQSPSGPGAKEKVGHGGFVKCLRSVHGWGKS